MNETREKEELRKLLLADRLIDAEVAYERTLFDFATVSDCNQRLQQRLARELGFCLELTAQRLADFQGLDADGED